jgi:endonuclease III
MSRAWNLNIGIAVDLHVHRISNRLGWVRTKSVNETKKALECIVPKDLWSRVNYVLVGFGQTICSARPRCRDCPIRDECPFGLKVLGSSNEI